jgi:hypothetical protein
MIAGIEHTAIHLSHTNGGLQDVVENLVVSYLQAGSWGIIVRC